MKKTTFLGVLVAALVATGALISLNTHAAAVSVSSTTTGNPVTITRNVTNVSNPVTNTFTYTITPDASNPSGATGEPTSATIAFSNETPTSGTATKDGTVDFSGATYTTLGDYTYTITETASTDTTNYPLDSTTTKQVIISVRNEMNGTTPTGNFVATVIPKDADPFTSAAPRTYFEFSKSVSGDMADVDQCFDFTVNIPAGNGVTAGDTFKVDTASTCSGNPANITAGTAATIKLKHGDTVKIALDGSTNQLPVGASYTITEAAATGYTTKVDGATTTTTTKTAVATDDNDFDTANKTSFLNEKPGTTPTGIIIKILPFVVLVAITVVAIFIVFRQKKHNA